MRHSAATHILPLREFSTSGAHRAYLNVTELLELVHARHQIPTAGAAEHKGKGKKRLASSLLAGGPRKRGRIQKQSDASSVDGDSDVQSSDADDVISYPVYQHISKLQYTTVVAHERKAANEELAGELGWLQEENELKTWLQQQRKGSLGPEPVTIDVGELHVSKATGHNVTLRHASAHGLITLPRDTDDFSLEDHDIRWHATRDELSACYHLSAAGRAQLSARVKLEILTENADEDMLPFHLHVEITASLISPAIFEPIYHSGKAVFAEVEEAQRRFLSYIFPDSPVPDGFHGVVDIPLLYSVLGPAPALYHGFLDLSAQPTSLVPTLLPFQRRSVAWMLQREGKVISNDGEVVPRIHTDADPLPLFWQRVEIAEGVSWYYHRITGRMSRDKPDDKKPETLGGILAEEPGLGKTLECISLIILNPAVDRNPTTSSWDSQARIHVKDVKVSHHSQYLAPNAVFTHLQTTLIVTPPVLAPQWADELKAHAPGLKVLIYEGWSKVPVPITEAEAQKAREARAKVASRNKTRGARAKAAAAKSKAKAAAERLKGKGKQPDGEDGEAEGADADTESEPDEDEDDDGIVDWCTYVNRFDVVITTYNVLQHDLSFARPPPVRPRRDGVVYADADRSRSPLIMCEWYRVIMDEVQMVGGGKTE